MNCGSCGHYIGGGDWNLCCDIPHKDYPCGFLCYEDTKACEHYVFAKNCLTCSVPHNKWTGCPKIDGKIPYPTYVCDNWECDDEHKYYLENIRWKKPDFTNHTGDDYPN